LFPVSKKGTKKRRMVLDLSRLNQFIPIHSLQKIPDNDYEIGLLGSVGKFLDGVVGPEKSILACSNTPKIPEFARLQRGRAIN